MRVSDLPFNRHIGITDDNGVVTIPVRDVHMNHLGTVHATVLFGVAEAGSGQFIIENFGKEFPDALAVTRTGTVKYKSPARGDIVAQVTGSTPDVQQSLTRLRLKGAAKIAIAVDIRCGGEVVATATFDWYFKRT